jgi:aarF domain-containing kinase
MPAGQARRVIEGELGGAPLEDVFEWINLDKPLGSASIAQVTQDQFYVFVIL